MKQPHLWRRSGDAYSEAVECPDCGVSLGSPEAYVLPFCPGRLTREEREALLARTILEESLDGE